MSTFLQKILPKYDIIVVGAGPAGLIASKILGEAGISTCLLDRRDPWREPVSCAEAVHREGLLKLTEVEDDWIRTPVNGVDFIAPNGVKIRFRQQNSGLIIDRAKMHKSLAERAANHGVHCNFRISVKNIGTRKNGIRTIFAKDLSSGEDLSIQANWVIDATGAGSSITNEANITDGRFDLEPAIFALVENVKIDPDFIEMYFSSDYAPGGYAWVFPRDEKVVNVGLVPGKRPRGSESPRKLFNRFLKDVLPDAQVLSYHGGAIACGQDHSSLATEGLFKAGDSANMVNPISRGGILEAMKGGTLAAESILRLIKASSLKDEEKEYNQYFKKWIKVQGAAHLRLAKAKKAFGRIPDDVFNRAAERILKIPEEKRTLPRIFFSTLASSPSLLWKMRSLMF